MKSPTVRWPHLGQRVAEHALQGRRSPRGSGRACRRSRSPRRRRRTAPGTGPRWRAAPSRRPPGPGWPRGGSPPAGRAAGVWTAAVCSATAAPTMWRIPAREPSGRPGVDQPHHGALQGDRAGQPVGGQQLGAPPAPALSAASAETWASVTRPGNRRSTSPTTCSRPIAADPSHGGPGGARVRRAGSSGSGRQASSSTRPGSSRSNPSKKPLHLVSAAHRHRRGGTPVEGLVRGGLLLGQQVVRGVRDRQVAARRQGVAVGPDGRGGLGVVPDEVQQSDHQDGDRLRQVEHLEQGRVGEDVVRPSHVGHHHPGAAVRRRGWRGCAPPPPGRCRRRPCGSRARAPRRRCARCPRSGYPSRCRGTAAPPPRPVP